MVRAPVGGMVFFHVKPGDRVTVNVEIFCGECFFCRHGYVNNCTDANGGWALGCRIDGGQAEYVRLPHADYGLIPVPQGGPDERWLYLSDILPTAWQAVHFADVDPDDTVAVFGLGPIGQLATRIARHVGAERVIGVDLVDVSSGGLVAHQKIVTGPGYQVPQATAVRRDGDVVVGAVGEITGWVFNRRGELIEGLTNDRVMSAPLPDLKSKLCIITAVGENKLNAIRAAITRPLVNGLITDEATAEAGSAGARALERSADAVTAGRTAVVVAHRLTQARGCDAIAVMSGGRIVELGTHDELVAAGGHYAQLWAAWSA